MTDTQHNAKPSAAAAPNPRGPTPVTPVIPEDVAAILGKPSLIHGEDAGEYENLMVRIAVEIKPKDFLEWLWLRDMVDNLWESRRLRRLKSTLIDIGMRRGARPLLLPLMPASKADKQTDLGDQAEQLASNHLGGNAEATATLRTLLAGGGLDEDALAASSLDRNLEKLERIERMLTSNERRRDQILRQIDQRRLVFADRFRGISDAVIDEVAVEQH